MTNQERHIKVLQQENSEQWDEITQLRHDAAQHEEIIGIFVDKITRLKQRIAGLEREAMGVEA